MTTLHKRSQDSSRPFLSPSQVEWALLLLALMTALILRLYGLGQFPPGLYRDEAFNGLDAVNVLQGDHAIFFPANNGREPLYIYLTAIAISLFGQTAFAIRFAAAVVGTLTTLPVYFLGKSWFGSRVGVLSAWIWAITLWPIHLSRIGLRVILLIPLITLVFWLGTMAYRKRKNGIWLLAGLVYGLTFYTYLAARFTPILLLAVLLFLLIVRQKDRLWPGVIWFVFGTFLTLLPFMLLVSQQPELILGRSGQVSLLHPDVNNGNLVGTLFRHIWSAIGMFLWRGDTILRHNPAGRPVFDLLLIIPFLIGLIWCIRHWRRPSSVVLLLWIGIMLGPTIFAADTPHFLRAAGVLPAILFIPAIGLDQIWIWPKMPFSLRSILVTVVLLGSLFLTLRDYASYARDPQVANAFESVASDLANQLNDGDAAANLIVDERLIRNWPSTSFLIQDIEKLHILKDPADMPEQFSPPVTFYVWPYESLNYLAEVLPTPVLISPSGSDLVFGELDDSTYQMYLRYEIVDVPTNMIEPVADFDGGFTLQRADVLELADNQLQVDVYWQADMDIDEELAVFVHVVGADGALLGQHDALPANGYWQPEWWQPGLLVQDRHTLSLSEPFNLDQHQILIGLYRPSTGERMPVSDPESGKSLGNAWVFDFE